MSTTRDLGGWWMGRCSIERPTKEGDDTVAELFIAGPPTEDERVEGIIITGFAAIVALRDLLTDEIDNFSERTALSIKDIPQ